MSSPTIRVHLGAHKTASTYVQEALDLNRDKSAAAGLAYWPRDSFRPLVATATKRLRDLKRSRKSRFLDPFSPRHSDAIKGYRRLLDLDCDVTISEENLLGGSAECFRGQIYPSAPLILSDFAAALPDRPVEILIALRSYSSFVSSLYTEALKHGAYIKPERAKAMRSAMRGAWPRLLTIIREAFPEATILVWRYEDFADLEEDILARLSGLPAAQIAKPVQGDILPSPSAQAIHSYLEEARDLTPVARQVRMRALRGLYPRTATSPKFVLWSEEEAATLAQDYAHDIEAIRNRGDAQFLV